MPDHAPDGEIASAVPAVQVRDVTKDFQSLRPLRVRHLVVAPQASVALLGFDAAMAEVFVNLLTGGSLPDAGEISVFGMPTSAITSHAEWMALIDRFGLISLRSVLLDQLTAEQNLAIPHTLAVESMTAAIRQKVRDLAEEIGLPAAQLTQSTATLPPASLLRVRLGRALALDPQVLLAEHPNAAVSPEEALVFARDLSRIRRARGISAIVLTADRVFAAEAADTVLALVPSTGELKPERPSAWQRLFGG